MLTNQTPDNTIGVDTTLSNNLWSRNWTLECHNENSANLTESKNMYHNLRGILRGITPGNKCVCPPRNENYFLEINAE
jgi:hypothetical protein